jgi:hypothetical protein
MFCAQNLLYFSSFSIIVIIYQGREDIFLSRGSLFPEKRGLKLSSLPMCIEAV